MPSSYLSHVATSTQQTPVSPSHHRYIRITKHIQWHYIDSGAQYESRATRARQSLRAGKHICLGRLNQILISPIDYSSIRHEIGSESSTLVYLLPEDSGQLRAGYIRRTGYSCCTSSTPLYTEGDANSHRCTAQIRMLSERSKPKSQSS